MEASWRKRGAEKDQASCSDEIGSRGIRSEKELDLKASPHPTSLDMSSLGRFRISWLGLSYLKEQVKGGLWDPPGNGNNAFCSTALPVALSPAPCTVSPSLLSEGIITVCPLRSADEKRLTGGRDPGQKRAVRSVRALVYPGGLTLHLRRDEDRAAGILLFGGDPR